ncbi:glycosyltransferase family 2 protein [Glaciihabitans sp. dw_435]|uniref:glycosyltransferase family 2 protein n=1 Tax=Glaciihabitans sp. dw_435 TaxID=2720081 RepID=UPI001BD1D792|nr:glycosyltransferase [Glaciihabitans sp. dw_435]
MQPRVTAILVARDGAEFLDRTLAAVASQLRLPDAVVYVDAGSSDATSALLAAAGPTQLVSTTRRSFGGGVTDGLHAASPAESEDDWLWLLSHDSAPHPRALSNLLSAVEIAPSVAIAGPKLMRWDRPDTIAEYGETMTRFGASIALVENELDQAQHDLQSDFLAVGSAGMLVRRSVWQALGGFDPALPSVDAALDFSVRVRLAGHRVIGVPTARVATVGGPELFDRRTISYGTRARLGRAAQLHRRLVYSRAIMLPLHWLSLVPLAIVRAIIHLIRKEPGAVGGEFSTALRAAFSRGVGPARRNLRRNRKLGWKAIRPLRMSTAEAREHHAQQRETAAAAASPAVPRTRVGFLSGGGAWTVLLTAIIGIISFGPLLGASAVSGGALAPLSATIGTLWSSVGYGWHQINVGFTGPSDPFTAVLAVLGSFTFWSPSLSIVVLYLAALPLAALGAWWCAVRFTERAWPAAVAAILWSLAPPFLSSLNGGHLGAVIAHLLLPWLVIAVLAAARNWSASAGAALLFAAVVASAPSLIPALLVALIAWMVTHPRRIHRLIMVVIPAAVLFAPVVVAQAMRGHWLAILTDPGIAVVQDAPSGWHLVLGSPAASFTGWESVGSMLGIADATAPVVAAVLFLPLAVVALAALFLPGSRRAVPALVLALLGFLTAVFSSHLQLSLVGSQAAGIWPAAGLSLYWLGLVGAVVIALDVFKRGVIVPALVVGIASTLVVIPLLAAPLAGTSAIQASSQAQLPAFVTAEASTKPGLGTLELTAQPDGGLAATLHRGTGTTLDEYSTLVTTSTTLTAAQKELATLAGNIASRSGLDIAAELDKQHIGFVLLADAPAGAARETRQRAADALDGNAILAPIGDTSQGLLWHYDNLAPGTAPTGDSTLGTPLGILILGVTALVFFVTLLLAVPTSRGRRRSTVAETTDEGPSFDEDDSV